MDEHNDCIESTSPEDDIEIAVNAIEQKNYQHAAFHIGCALSSDPGRQEWLELLDNLIAETKDPLSLAELKEKNYFATVAVRAYILARLKQTDEALQLLFNVIPAKPDTPYLRWLPRWLDDDEVARQVSLDVVSECLVSVVKNFHILANVEDVDQSNLTYLIFLIRKFHKLAPEHGDLLTLGTMIFRRMGLLSEALELAEAACKHQPGMHSSVVLAGVRRDMNELEPALAAFQDALRYEPDDLSIRLDVGDMMMTHGQLEESLKWYQDVLNRDAAHPWALPSSYFLKHHLEPTGNYREQLFELAKSQPDNERAQQLAESLMPYIGFLPQPSEAIINILRQMMEQPEKFKSIGSQIKITLSHLEAPSAVLAFNMQLAMMSLPTKLNLIVTKVPKPDPREPKTKVNYQLWRYQETQATPAIPPPATTRVASIMAQFAGRPYSLSEWSEIARQVAGELGPQAIDELLAVMVHPPLPNFPIPAWVWLQHIQIAAALTIANLDEGWKGSLRRRALLSLANGPVDWSIDAAVLALTEIALVTPEAQDEILKLFITLIEQQPEEGACCYCYAVITNTLRLPNLPDDFRPELLKWQRAIENGE